jgi:DNA-binding NarL/FixJ family response regulator
VAPIRLFILGDVRLHREGLAIQLAGFSALQVIGAGGLDDAVRTLRATPADIALVDTAQLDIATVVGELRRVLRRLRTVAVGVREVESEVLACAAVGVDGYIPMDATIDDVVTVVESVMRNELVVSPKVAASLYHSVAALGSEAADRPRATGRRIDESRPFQQGNLPSAVYRALHGQEPCPEHHAKARGSPPRPGGSQTQGRDWAPLQLSPRLGASVSHAAARRGPIRTNFS